MRKPEGDPIVVTCVDSRCLRIHHRRKIHLKPVVEGSGKEVYRDRPHAKELPTHLLAEGPLGSKDLRAPAESVGEDIHFPRNKLR